MAKKIRLVDPMHHFDEFEGYRNIAGLHPGYKINIKGEIINPVGYLVPTRKKDVYGEWVYVVIRKVMSGVVIDTTELISRAVLVSAAARHTFFHIHPTKLHDPHPLSKATMYFMDDNPLNIHPSNTVLAPLPKDVEYKPGWRYIPGFSSYVINERGALWSFLRNKINTWSGGEPDNYLAANVVADIVANGRKDRNYKLKQHRALMLAFTEYPKNVRELHVNHKNTIRYDNSFPNLEWCTAAENSRHAIEFGTRDTKAVVTKHVISGIEKRFRSLSEAGKHYNVHLSAIAYRCESDGQLIYKPATLFKYADSTTPWPDLEYAKKHLVSKEANYTFVERNGVITRYEDASELPEIIGVNKNTLFSQLQRCNLGLYNGFRIWRSFEING